jgi:hypothetical protein
MRNQDGGSRKQRAREPPLTGRTGGNPHERTFPSAKLKIFGLLCLERLMTSLADGFVN